MCMRVRTPRDITAIVKASLLTVVYVNSNYVLLMITPVVLNIAGILSSETNSLNQTIMLL